MIPISYLFEQPNVPNEQPNGLTAPFGSFAAYQSKNKEILSKAQNINKLSVEQQKKFMVDNDLINI